jgi:DNA replication and repair protein RecF
VVSDARAEAANRLVAEAEAVFKRIGAPGLCFAARYARSAPPDADAYMAELQRRRAQDFRRGSASMGPHRDDLAMELDGHPVRVVASQGQHRAVVLALKLAEIAVIGAARDVRPILLLDDVSSELDRERSAALFEVLREERGQVFLSTTRPDLIETGTGGGAEWRRDFTVESGQVRPG